MNFSYFDLIYNIQLNIITIEFFNNCVPKKIIVECFILMNAFLLLFTDIFELWNIGYNIVFYDIYCASSNKKNRNLID